MKKTILISTVVIIICSCKWAIGKKYGINQNRKFVSYEEYGNYLVKTKKLDSSLIVYPEKRSLTGLYQIVMESGSAEYLGSFINDSTALRKSEFLMDNLSCMGRALSEINKNISFASVLDSSLYVKQKLKGINLKSFNTGQTVNLNDPKYKLKILLLYSTQMGKVFDSFYKEIRKKYVANKDVKIFIVAMDVI